MDKINDLSYMFCDCSSLEELPDISKWNTINIINMKGLFSGCESLTKLPDISKWKTENINDLSEMFNGCSKLSKLPEINKWKFKNNVNIIGIFSGCSSLLLMPDITSWNIIEDNYNYLSEIISFYDTSKKEISIISTSNNRNTDLNVSFEYNNNSFNNKGKNYNDFSIFEKSEEEKKELEEYYENFYN